MKKLNKVLTLSALGCVATVGAVFAAFNLDPTTETDDISIANVDVDLSAHVFSQFDPITEFDYYDESQGKLMYSDVPISNPSSYTEGGTTKTSFKFTTKDVEGGTGSGKTLDLKCKNSYNYADFEEYLDWRRLNPEPAVDDPTHASWVEENIERAPRGFAFKYTYDESFLERIKEDDIKPTGMEDWRYAIYKTNFASALTQSDFKATAEGTELQGLDDFGVTYTNPDPSNPNYRDFVWNKSNPLEAGTWDHGSNAFFIQPDVTFNETESKVEYQNSGVIIFNGTEFTDNLFGGEFPDDVAAQSCAAYLEAKNTSGEYTHKGFNMRVKATEYFKVAKHELKTDDSTGDSLFAFTPDSEDLLETNNRYSFTMKATADTQALFEDGYNFYAFCIFNNTFADTVALIDENAGATPSDLLLKVTKNSANSNGEEDVTDKFAYINDPSDSIFYRTVKYVGEPGELTLNANDTLTISFMFRKNSTGKAQPVDWKGVAFELTKGYEGDHQCDDYEGSAEKPTLYYRDFTDSVMSPGKTTRFTFKVLPTRYLEKFTLTGSTDPIVLTQDQVGASLTFMDKIEIPLNSKYYTVNPDGTITIDAESIANDFRISSANQYRLGIEIKNTTEEDVAYTRAECTCVEIPMPTVLSTSDKYTEETGEAKIKSGYFVYDNTTAGVQLEPDGLYAVEIPLDTKQGEGDFVKALNKMITAPEGDITAVEFGVFFLNSEGKPLSLGAAADFKDFKITRINDQKETIKDTPYYTYEDGTGSGEAGIKSTDPSNWLEYAKAISGGISEKYNDLQFRFTYKGTQKLDFASVRFAVNVTCKE